MKKKCPNCSQEMKAVHNTVSSTVWACGECNIIVCEPTESKQLDAKDVDWNKELADLWKDKNAEI